jgi:hypothetical protein
MSHSAVQGQCSIGKYLAPSPSPQKINIPRKNFSGKSTKKNTLNEKRARRKWLKTWPLTGFTTIWVSLLGIRFVKSIFM